MKLALALETTPDTFLTGTIRYDDEPWKDVAELLKDMNSKQLSLAQSFLIWLREQEL